MMCGWVCDDERRVEVPRSEISSLGSCRAAGALQSYVLFNELDVLEPRQGAAVIALAVSDAPGSSTCRALAAYSAPPPID